MFGRKVHSQVRIGAVGLVLAMGSIAVASSDTEKIVSKIAVEEEVGSPIGKFLKETLHITVGGYGDSLNVWDLFKVGGERHHRWLQVGGFWPDILGAGVGYRYLAKGDHPYQDWFIGGYGYGGWEVKNSGGKKEKERDSRLIYDKRWHWNIGIELGTARYQLMFNRYGLKPVDEKRIWNYQEEEIGYSGRISTYYWQKMSPFGRFNPFFVGAYTWVKATQNGEHIASRWVKNGGFGVRWELSYFALEVKAIWDSIKPGMFLGAYPHIGFQVNLAGGGDLTANYAKHRVRQMPISYKPNYYQYYEPKAPQSDSNDNARVDDEKMESSGGVATPVTSTSTTI